LSCVGEEEDPIDLEISPFLIAASVISENERTTIEQGLSTAMINVMDSIEAQYTILGFKQNEKQQLKRLS
jgi:hypothetical protein